MKNIRGKSVKKSRDWIQEKKVMWSSYRHMKKKTDTKLKTSKKITIECWICRTVPEGRERMSDLIPSSLAEREKTNFDSRRFVKDFLWLMGSFVHPVLQSRFIQIFSNIQFQRLVLRLVNGSLEWAGTSRDFGRRRRNGCMLIVGFFLRKTFFNYLLVADRLRMGEQAELLCRVDFPLYAIASVSFNLCHCFGWFYFHVSFVFLPSCFINIHALSPLWQCLSLFLSLREATI